MGRGKRKGQPRALVPAQLLPCEPKGLPGEGPWGPPCAATATVFQERYALRASPARPGVCSRLAHGLLALELSGLGSVPGELSALFL